MMLVVKNPPARTGDTKDTDSIPQRGRSLGRKWQPTPVFLPGISHGQRSLAGYSPWGCKESDMTEHLMWSVEIMKNENESHSVVSVILQARILESVAFPLSRGF